MNEEGPVRPSPEALLRRVKAEEERSTRASLRIFFGYAPGVGKTYAMLVSARRLLDQGVDTVVGWVETHGRAETAWLAEGFEGLPRRNVAYRGTKLAEFDLDGALERKPKVLLLDELAHTNVPGSRQAKRWQDVLELLDAGIDVHTTLNVQHVESLNDVVAQITTVRVRETVPDSILERADEIELVDLPPDELLARLSEGKVYVPEEARRAADHFFRRGNLLALRELTMRRTAERVDADVRAYRREHDIERPWPAAERILVGVGPSPASARVIRGARRMAAGLRAAWTAAYVEAPDAYPMTEEDRARLQAHLRLAESLGAEVIRLSGHRVGEELLRCAREHNVTRIVIGKPTHSPWRDLWKGSLVNQIVRGSGDLEVHFISGDEAEEADRSRNRSAQEPEGRSSAWAPPLFVAGATALSFLGRGWLSQTDIVIVYLLTIMLVAYLYRRRPTVAAAGLSVAAYDFFFVPPYYTFSVEDMRHVLTFVMMFALGLTISTLTSILKRQRREARHREARTAALYSLTRELVALTDETFAAQATARHASDVFGGDAFVLLKEEEGGLRLAGSSASGAPLAEEDLGVVRWTADHARPAGRGTDTLPGAGVICLPLWSGPETQGVLALRRPGPQKLDEEERSFLDVFVRQAALAIERSRLSEAARASALRARTEEMRSSLLSAVSHDLRTPLAAIAFAAASLREDGSELRPDQRRELADGIGAEVERVDRLIANILDMVRLESGGIRPKSEWVPLEEIVGSALTRLESKLGDRDVRLDIPEDLPLVSVDPVLFEQVFVNLIENSVKHAGEASMIEMAARASG
ncbi:MAG: sensor histidine kinase KdpD, partial [Candidatus Latescibacterota bacterium]